MQKKIFKKKNDPVITKLHQPIGNNEIGIKDYKKHASTFSRFFFLISLDSILSCSCSIGKYKQSAIITEHLCDKRKPK